MKRFATLTLLVVLLAGCAGRTIIRPGAQAFLDLNGNRAVAVGVEGPSLHVDSDGLILGPSVGTAQAASQASSALNSLGTVMSVIGGLVFVALAGLAVVLVVKRKKE